MGTFNFTKNDFKLLLAASAILPLIGILVGFYIATNSTPSNLDLKHNENVTTKTDSSVITNSEQLASNSQQLSADTESDIAPHKVEKLHIAQAGLFSVHKNATLYFKTLDKKQINVQIVNSTINDIPIYRVITGTFESRNDAMKHASIINEIHGLKLYITTLQQSSVTL